MGAEKILGKAIHAFVYGRKLEGQEAAQADRELAKDANPEAVVGGPGSQNIPLMRMALKACMGSILALRFFRDFFRLSRQRFMGRETMSRIYGLWHLIAVLLVYWRGPSEFKEDARDWICCFCALLWATSDSTGRTCFGGMRSAGHDIHHDCYEWVLAVAMRTNEGRWTKGWTGRWEYAVLTKLEPVLAEATAGFYRAKNKAAFLSGFRAMVPVFLVKTKTAGMYWMPHNINSNTAPWLAAKVEAGRPAEILPYHGGSRIRQKFDKARVNRTANILTYHGDLYPDGRMEVLNETEADVTLAWGATLQDPPSPDPEPAPEEDPVYEGDDDPISKRDPSVSLWQRFKDWLRRIF